MANFTVLTDSDVQKLLRTARAKEVKQFSRILLQALQDYSTKNESQYQPLRASVERGQQSSLFMPSTLPDTLGVKVVGIPSPGGKGTLNATLLICDSLGKAVGVLNAAELTAFRTSLGAMLLFQHRKTVKHLVMFGSGKQAYWHIRLALIMRGADIETVTVVNRSSGRASELVESLQSDDLLKKEYPHIKIETLITSDADVGEKLKEAVTSATSIHCAVPSTEPLFPAEWLASSSSEGMKRDLYVSAIGSYKLSMRELDPEYLKRIKASSELYVPEGRETPVVVVDSIDGCFHEAGELVDAGFKEQNLLEIGRLAEIREGGASAELEDWLATGLVVYKSVGIGIMDICIGNALIELAQQKNLGVDVSDF